MHDGQFIFPAILLGLYLASRTDSGAQTGMRDGIFFVMGAMMAVLQMQASWIGIRGLNAAPRLPIWTVPAFLAALVGVISVNLTGFSLFRKPKEVATDSAAEASESSPASARGRSPRSPRSPRSLIKSLSSPETGAEMDDSDDEDYKEQKYTPVQRRGRSPAKRKTPAKKTPSKMSAPAARAQSRSPRRSSPRKSPRTRK